MAFPITENSILCVIIYSYFPIFETTNHFFKVYEKKLVELVVTESVEEQFPHQYQLT